MQYLLAPFEPEKGKAIKKVWPKGWNMFANLNLNLLNAELTNDYSRKNKTVGEKISPKESRHVLIVTTWRSGSSFTGGLLDEFPGTFYSYEPLLYNELSKDKDMVRTLEHIFKCEFDGENGNFLKFIRRNPLGIHKVPRSCTDTHPLDMCYTPSYLEDWCSYNPIKLIKTVRLSMEQAVMLSEIKDLNLKIVLLVRDPRGVAASRMEKGVEQWCKNTPKCFDMKVSCGITLSDVEIAEKLKKKRPESVYIMRYEDLSLHVNQLYKELIRFLGWPLQKYWEKMKNFIDKSTKAMDEGNNFSLTRDSKKTTFKWRTTLPWYKVKDVQDSCSELMTKMGYMKYNSKEEYKKIDSPLLKPQIPIN